MPCPLKRIYKRERNALRAATSEAISPYQVGISGGSSSTVPITVPTIEKSEQARITLPCEYGRVSIHVQTIFRLDKNNTRIIYYAHDRVDYKLLEIF